MAATLFELTPDGKGFKLSENDVEKQLLDFLGAMGWTAVRQHPGKFVPYAKAMEGIEKGELPARAVITMAAEFTADWLFIHGHLPPLWVEVKRPGKKPSSGQLQFLRERRLVQQLACWTDKYEDFLAWYQEYVRELAHRPVKRQGDEHLRAIPSPEDLARDVD